MTKDEKYLKSLNINSVARFNELLKRKAFSPSNKYVQELRANLGQAPEPFPNNMPVAIDGGLGKLGVVPKPDPLAGKMAYEKLVAQNQPMEDMSLAALPMGKMLTSGFGKIAKSLPGTKPVNTLGKRPLVDMKAIPEEEVLKRASSITKEKNLQAAIDESRRQANKRAILENQVKEELFQRNPKLRGQF